VAPPGTILLGADYSQIELRLLAHLTLDPVLVDAFARGEDIHRRTAAEVFGVAPEAVTADQRRRAKVINFGILYGMGPQRLSRELAITLAEAEDIIRRYFERYAYVRAFADRVVEEGRSIGYVTTMTGAAGVAGPERPSPPSGGRAHGLEQLYPGERIDVCWRSRSSGVEEVRMLQVRDELLFDPEDRLERTAEVAVAWIGDASPCLSSST
jgi:DNA polymerase-1